MTGLYFRLKGEKSGEPQQIIQFYEKELICGLPLFSPFYFNGAAVIPKEVRDLIVY
jgi:hypothetical protein